MLFPISEYEELPETRRNTLQVFITNRCNMNCKGCFARKIMRDNNQDISMEEYSNVIEDFLKKGGKQINLLGGEPLLHPLLKDFLKLNKEKRIKTTIYTNGSFLSQWDEKDLLGAKVRTSFYSLLGGVNEKGVKDFPKSKVSFDPCFMISSKTTVEELLESARILQGEHNCKIFFISSLREMDNPRHEFFDDTALTMNLLKYKELIHEFLSKYDGDMEIHIAKKGVFESCLMPGCNKCRFANYFIGGKIIQCPFDIVNKKFQGNYEFGKRPCQQNSTCLMTKVIFKRKQ